MRMTRSILTVAVAALVPTVSLVGQSNTEKEEFTAFAINMGTIGTGANSMIDITIERWSTEAERAKLIEAFQKGQQDGLLDALEDIEPRVGFMRLPNSLGYDLKYARQVPDEEGGRRILIATDRRIGFQEARTRPRTFDYPFTLIELRLNRNNEGQGKMSVATKITWNQKANVLELENYNSEPVRLNNVRKR
jgi:hypothetical protein